MLYAQINIQDRIRTLANLDLSQQDRWNATGSLAWWQSYGQTFYALTATMLIAAGLAAAIYSRFRKAS